MQASSAPAFDYLLSQSPSEALATAHGEIA